MTIVLDCPSCELFTWSSHLWGTLYLSHPCSRRGREYWFWSGSPDQKTLKYYNFIYLNVRCQPFSQYFPTNKSLCWYVDIIDMFKKINKIMLILIYYYLSCLIIDSFETNNQLLTLIGPGGGKKTIRLRFDANTQNCIITDGVLHTSKFKFVHPSHFATVSRSIGRTGNFWPPCRFVAENLKSLQFYWE